MNTRSIAQLTIAGALLGSVWLVAGTSAHARQTSQNTADVTLRTRDADARKEIQHVFDQMGISYTVTPSPGGLVTLTSDRKVDLGELQAWMHRDGFAYRYQSGGYDVSPAQDKGGKLMSVSYSNADVREVLRNLFRQSGDSYAIDPAVQGTVTLELKNVVFDTALTNILRQVNATYRIEGGVYQVVPSEPNQAVAVQAPPLPEPTQPAETVLTQDAKFLYVVRGTVVYKLQKSDLKVTAIGQLPQLPTGK